MLLAEQIFIAAAAKSVAQCVEFGGEPLSAQQWERLSSEAMGAAIIFHDCADVRWPAPTKPKKKPSKKKAAPHTTLSAQSKADWLAAYGKAKRKRAKLVENAPERQLDFTAAQPEEVAS
jgi:hypothetical protein